MKSISRLTPGKMLRDVRVYHGIERNSVAHGLCTEQTYYRIESGAIEPDGLLFACLWERMGLSLHRVSILLSDEELKWYYLKADAYKAVQDRDVSQIRKLMAEMSLLRKINRVISAQFLDYLDYAAEMIETGLSEHAYQRIKNSVYRTTEDPLRIDLSSMRLGQEEIQIICAYLSAEYKRDATRYSEVKGCIESLNQYVINNISDKSAQGGVLSKVAATWVSLYGDKVNVSDAMMDVEIIRQTKGIYDLPLLLKHLGEADIEGKGKYRIWGETLLWLFNDFADGYEYREEVIYPNLPHINEIGDFIRYGRINKGLTQETASEGICEPESYSRIESGRRSPHKRNLEQIVKRLNIEWGYYKGIVISSEYQPLFLRLEIEKHIEKNELEKGSALLDELEAHIDMSVPQNIQYCGLERISIGLRSGDLEPSIAITQLNDLLMLTEASEEISRYYSPHESGILLFIARLYRNSLKMTEEAMRISERFIKNESRKRFPDIWRIVQFERIMAGIYNDKGNWRAETELSGIVLKNLLLVGSAVMLEQFIDLYAEGLGEGTIESDYEKRLLIAAAYIADLYYEQSNSKRFKNYLKEKRIKGDDWYQ